MPTTPKLFNLAPWASSVVLASLLGGCDGIRSVSERDLVFIPAAEIQDLMTEQAEEPDERILLLVDPRPEAAFATCRIPNAQNYILSDVPPKPGKDPRFNNYDAIVVYGDHPNHAAAKAMAKRLMSIKIDHVKVYDGGLADWTARGYPLESGTPEAAPEAGN